MRPRAGRPAFRSLTWSTAARSPGSSWGWSSEASLCPATASIAGSANNRPSKAPARRCARTGSAATCSPIARSLSTWSLTVARSRRDESKRSSTHTPKHSRPTLTATAATCCLSAARDGTREPCALRAGRATVDVGHHRRQAIRAATRRRPRAGLRRAAGLATRPTPQPPRLPRPTLALQQRAGGSRMSVRASSEKRHHACSEPAQSHAAGIGAARKPRRGCGGPTQDRPLRLLAGRTRPMSDQERARLVDALAELLTDWLAAHPETLFSVLKSSPACGLVYGPERKEQP